MAEIHVQAKKKTTPAWIWIVAGLVIIAAIVFVILNNNQKKQNNTTNQSPPASMIQPAPSHEIIYS